MINIKIKLIPLDNYLKDKKNSLSLQSLLKENNNKKNNKIKMLNKLLIQMKMLKLKSHQKILLNKIDFLMLLELLKMTALYVQLELIN
jgi:uridine kinase